jgi:hypothetical protein
MFFCAQSVRRGLGRRQRLQIRTHLNSRQQSAVSSEVQLRALKSSSLGLQRSRQVSQPDPRPPSLTDATLPMEGIDVRFAPIDVLAAETQVPGECAGTLIYESP